MKKANVKMNKSVYLGLLISKTLMYEFWYDYIKQKYQNNVKLCYMDPDSFIIYIKTEDFYEDIADDVEKGFDTSNYDCNRPLPKGKNEKVIGLMKDKLGGKIMTEFVALRPKTYSYLMDNDSEAKKAKGTKRCVIKKVLKFNDYKDCLLNNEIILKPQQRFKSEAHNMYTENYNPNKKIKVLIVLDDMIGDRINNKKLNSIVPIYLLEVENLIFLLPLLHSLILKRQKMLD